MKLCSYCQLHLNCLTLLYVPSGFHCLENDRFSVVEVTQSSSSAVISLLHLSQWVPKGWVFLLLSSLANLA